MVCHLAYSTTAYAVLVVAYSGTSDMVCHLSYSITAYAVLVVTSGYDALVD